MAEMVASAVVGETVGRISTFLIDQPDHKSTERDDMERLEMAGIKMEAALRMSNRWQITDVPMLRWRRKLKNAAQDCGDTLRHCKQRALEDQEMRRSSLPRRIAHAAKSFMPSFNGCNSISVDVQRFERFADNTGEFLKLVEFGGTPRRQYMFFNPLIGDLLAGKTLRYQALQGGKFYYLGIRPTSFAERGVEAIVGFAFQDLKEPAKSLHLRLMVRLSESSNIFGIIVKCMQSAAATPHFMNAAGDVTRELIQLPTQDFSWMTHSPYGEMEYWIGVHGTLTQWFRPDPLCCNEHYDLVTCSNNNTNVSSSSRSRLASMCPEEVIMVYLQWHISLSDQHKTQQNSGTQHERRKRSSPNSGSTPLKLGLLFIPHDSLENINPEVESYAFEVIDGNEQKIVHKNASLQDVDEKLLPKAIDHLCQNSESKMYQMCLRFRHGTAHLSVEKMVAQVPSVGRRKTARSQSQIRDKRMDQKRETGWLEVSKDPLKLWAVRASEKLPLLQKALSHKVQIQRESSRGLLASTMDGELASLDLNLVTSSLSISGLVPPSHPFNFFV